MSAQVPEVRGEQVDPPPPTRNSELDPLRDQIEQLQARVRTPLEFASIFVAKITGGNSDDGYNWIEQVFNAGDFEDFTDGRQGDNADTDYFPPTPIDPNAVIQVDNLYVFMELLDPAGGQYVYAIMTGGGGTIAFKITSATATQGLYNAKSVAMGTATISSYGTLAAEEDLFVWNGAETAIATANNLLLSPNTSTFDVVASGTVVGVDAGSGKKIVIAWIGYAGCTSA